MVVSENLKNAVRAVLLSKEGGVPLTKFERDFRELTLSPLKYKALGFGTLEQFIHAIPDAARLELSKDGTVRIFGIARPDSYMNKVTKKAQGRIPASHLKEIQNRSPTKNGLPQRGSNTSATSPPPLVSVSNSHTPLPRPKSDKRTDGKPDPGDPDYKAILMEPDDRGWYTICFAENKMPKGQDLEEMFAAAGPVMSVHHAAGLTFVRYNNPDAAYTAFQMFQQYEPRIGRNRKKGIVSKRLHNTSQTSIASVPSSEDGRAQKFLASGDSRRRSPLHMLNKQLTTNQSASASSPPVQSSTSLHQNGVDTGDEDRFCTELFVGNIPNDRACTKEMVRDLFSEYRLAHLFFKRSRKKTYAFALLYSRREAEDALKKLNGYDLMGRRLRIRISEHPVAGKVGVQKFPIPKFVVPRPKRKTLFEYLAADVGLPDLEEELPDLKEELPDLEDDDLSDQESVEILNMRTFNAVLPDPKIARQVVAFGTSDGERFGSDGDEKVALKITRPVFSAPTAYTDFALEVSRRMETGSEVSWRTETGSEISRRMGTGLEVSRRFETGLDVSRRMGTGSDVSRRTGTASEVLRWTESEGSVRDSILSRNSLPAATTSRSSEIGDLDIGDEKPSILVANFRTGTSMEELRALFHRYKPQHVQNVSSQKCTKAIITLQRVQDVKAAIEEMDQEEYNGQVLLVDVPFQCPRLRTLVLGPDAAEPGKMKDKDKMTASELLKARARILDILKCVAPKVLLGQRVEVLVTSTISDSFFWGQIVDDESIIKLKMISTQINSVMSDRLDRHTSFGPCKAVFDSDGMWYRAWVLGNAGAKVQVFYTDYGNVATIPWMQAAKLADPRMWELRPLAIPFMLTEKVLNLKERELTNITVEVAALGTPEEGGYVVAKPISLMGNWQALIDADTSLIIHNV